MCLPTDKIVLAAALEADERGQVLQFQRPGRVVEVEYAPGTRPRFAGRCWRCLRGLINGLCPKCSRPVA